MKAERPQSFGSVLRPPGWIYYGLLLLALIPPLVCCVVMPPLPRPILRALLFSYDCFWIGMAGYGVAVAGYALLFDRPSLFYSRTLFPRVRWIGPPMIFFLALFLGLGGWFNVAFPMSRPELDALVVAHRNLPGRVGEFDVGKIEYLPSGEAKLYCDVGFNWFDRQGLAYCPNGPSPAVSSAIEHVAGPWYRFCDG